MSVSGIAAYIEYGKQTAFATALAAGASTRAFGMDQKISNISINENMFELGDLNSALVQKFAFGHLDGAFSVDWVLSNPWWIDLILGNASSVTTAGVTTHTYDDSKTVNSITAEFGIDTTTDRVIQLQRATVKDISISTSVGELVRCRGNFQFGATPTTAGTALDSSVSTDDITTPYTFASGAILESPEGTALAEVQSMELNMNPNITQVFEPNSVNAVSAYKGKLALTGKFSLAVKDNAWWNKVRARAEPASNTLKFRFTNGGATTAERTVQFTLTGLGLGQLSMNVDQYTLLTEEIPFVARDLTATAINATATPP